MSAPQPPGERFNFAQHLFDLNRGRAGSVAYIDDNESMTYGELDERARRMAATLLAMGMRREDFRIAVAYWDVDPDSALGREPRGSRT